MKNEKNSGSELRVKLDNSNYRPDSAEAYSTASMRQLNDSYDPMINTAPVKGSFKHQAKGPTKCP